MQKFGKVDGNHKSIVDELRTIPGVSVANTSALGNGFPDIVVGFRGQNWMFEIKDPEQPRSKRQLTPYELDFHARWTGQIAVVTTAYEIMRKVGVIT